MINSLELQYEYAFYLFTYENDIKTAIKEYKKIISQDKNFAKAYHDLGYLYKLENDLKSSEEYFTKYLNLNTYNLYHDEIKEMIV